MPPAIHRRMQVSAVGFGCATGSAAVTRAPRVATPAAVMPRRKSRRVRSRWGMAILSIPDVALIILDFVTVQKLAELVLVMHAGVVFVLVLDVDAHLLNVRRADRERAIAVLPVEV